MRRSLYLLVLTMALGLVAFAPGSAYAQATEAVAGVVTDQNAR